MRARFDPGAYWRELALRVHAREGTPPPAVTLPWRPADVMPLVERLARDRAAREEARLAVLDAMRIVELRCDDALIELHWLLGRRKLNAARVQVLLHVVGHWMQTAIADFHAQAWHAHVVRPGRRDGAAVLRRAIERALRAGALTDEDILDAVTGSTGRSRQAVAKALATYRGTEGPV